MTPCSRATAACVGAGLCAAQVVEPELPGQVRLVVPRKQRSCCSRVRPLRETRSPPLVVLRRRMELRQVEGHDRWLAHASSLRSIVGFTARWARRALNARPYEVLHGLPDGRHRVALREARPMPGCRWAVLERPRDGLRERLGGIGRHHGYRRQAVHDLERRTDRGRHDRELERQRLDERAGEPLPPGRHRQHVGRHHEIRYIVPWAEEPHPVLDTAGHDRSAQALALVARPSSDQDRHTRDRDPWCRADEDVQALRPLMTADGQDNRGIRVDAQGGPRPGSTIDGTSPETILGAAARHHLDATSRDQKPSAHHGRHRVRDRMEPGDQPRRHGVGRLRGQGPRAAHVWLQRPFAAIRQRRQRRHHGRSDGCRRQPADEVGLEELRVDEVDGLGPQHLTQLSHLRSARGRPKGPNLDLTPGAQLVS